MSGYGSGLNFQQGHYNDPLASMQASLGAGSMFAKTLSGMQQFDQDEAKLQMMRQDRERQAKLDSKAEAADALAAKEKAYNLGAESAVNDIQARADLGNQMFEHGLTNPEQAMLVNQSDSQIKASNAGFKVSDSLAGIDKTKLNDVQKKRYDELAAADGHLNTTSADGKDTYNVSTKLGLLKDAYSLGGFGDKDAYDKATKSLGISTDSEQGVLKSNDEQNAFVNRYTNLASTDPLFGNTKLEKLADFRAQWIKDHPEDKSFTTSGVEGLRSSLSAANTAAIAERKKELNTLLAQKASAGDNVVNKDLDNAIRLAEMRIRAADHETSSEDKLAKALTGVTGGSKLSESDKYAVNLASTLKQYATNSKPEVGQNIIDSYKQAQAKGYSAAEAAAIIQGGIHTDGIPEKNASQSYKFDSQAMFNRGPSKSYTDSNDYVALRQQQLAGNDAQKEAEFAQLQKLFAAKGGSSTLAALDKQIYDLNRTPQEAFRQAAMQAGKDFAYDEDLAGHKGIATQQSAAEQAAINKMNEDTNKKTNADTSKNKQPSPTGNSLYDKTSMILSEKENSNPYNLYEDHYEKDGKIRPAIGKGFLIADVNKEFAKNGLPTVDTTKAGWGSYKLSDPQKKIVDSFEHNFISGKIDAAQKALPMLDPKNSGYNDIVAATASGFHQYGSGSKVLNPVIEEVQNLISQGKYQDAINFVGNSPYGRAYKERAVDLMHGIESYAKADGYKGKLTADAKFDFKDQASFIKFYNDVDKWTKSQNMNSTDREKTLKGLRDRAAESKYKVNFRGYEDTAGQSHVSSVASPNDNMVRLLHSDNNNAPSIDSLISKGYMQSTGKTVSQVRNEASDAANNFDYYRNMHKNQYEIRQKQLEKDGKSDVQVSVIKDAGLNNAYRNAKSAKERLQIHAEALQKLAEQDSLKQSLLGF